MNLVGVGSIVKTVGDILDDLVTTDKERLELELKRFEIEAELIEKVHEINIEEARHPSIFVAGWRPAIGWIGAIALGYQFVVYPLLLWLWQILQGYGIIAKNISPPPVFEAEVLWTIIAGMLGIAGLRTYDKIKRVDTKRVG